MAIIAKLRERGRGRPGRERRLRYVQTLPTLCTLGNLICGFGAMHLCIRAMVLAGANQNPADVNTMDSVLLERVLPSHLVMAAYLVFVAMIFDALDGRLARWTRHTTDFGAQLDSLADVVSFGVVPPLLVIALLTRQLATPELVVAPFGENLLGRLAWLCSAVYVACAALRLARFNVENEPVEQAHQTFRGLPSPGAAGALVALVIVHDNAFFFARSEVFGSTARILGEQGGPLSTWLLWTMPLFALLLGLLMVSRFHYVHITNRYLRGRRSIGGIVQFLIIGGLIVLFREFALCIALLGYACSGPLMAWVRRLRKEDGPTGGGEPAQSRPSNSSDQASVS